MSVITIQVSRILGKLGTQDFHSTNFFNQLIHIPIANLQLYLDSALVVSQILRCNPAYLDFKVLFFVE